MNREIKFRGKDINNGWWIFGDLLQYNDGDVNIGEHDNHWTDDGLHWNTHRQVVCVDEDTVGQYTGLKDKNGVEIYEGDILYDIHGCRYGVVEWKEKGFDFGTRYKDCYDNIVCEIVGNIHDNPELLKKEEQP